MTVPNTPVVPMYAERPVDCVCHRCPKVRRPTDFCAVCPVHGVKADIRLNLDVDE